MNRTVVHRVVRFISEGVVIAACLWESGFLGWLTNTPGYSPGYIRADPISLLINLGGEAPQLTGVLQPLTTLFLACGIYLISKTTAAILFQQFDSRRR